MSKKLIQEPPLQVLPSLAEDIGLNEALVLQQVHYWIQGERTDNWHDGKKWVYNTYSQWQDQFPFWSRSTIRRTINSLEDQGLLLSAEPNKENGNRTKWYRPNYSVLDARTGDEQMGGQNEQTGDGKMNRRGVQNEQSRTRDNNAHAQTETTTETSTKDISARAREEDHPAIEVFVEEVGRRPYPLESNEIPEVVGTSDRRLAVFRKQCRKSLRSAGHSESVDWGILAENFEEAVEKEDPEDIPGVGLSEDKDEWF